MLLVDRDVRVQPVHGRFLDGKAVLDYAAEIVRARSILPLQRDPDE
jgi:hypothetical protein